MLEGILVVVQILQFFSTALFEIIISKILYLWSFTPQIDIVFQTAKVLL